MTQNETKTTGSPEIKPDAEASCPGAGSAKRTSIGGQALIEGLIMFGPRNSALAVRKADGTIHIETHDKSLSTGALDRIPIVRGCVRFFKQIVTGMGALIRSADLSEMVEEQEESRKDNEAGTPGEEPETVRAANAEKPGEEPETVRATNAEKPGEEPETVRAANAEKPDEEPDNSRSDKETEQ